MSKCAKAELLFPSNLGLCRRDSKQILLDGGHGASPNQVTLNYAALVGFLYDKPTNRPPACLAYSVGLFSGISSIILKSITSHSRRSWMVSLHQLLHARNASPIQSPSGFVGAISGPCQPFPSFRVLWWEVVESNFDPQTKCHINLTEKGLLAAINLSTIWASCK